MTNDALHRTPTTEGSTNSNRQNLVYIIVKICNTAVCSADCISIFILMHFLGQNTRINVHITVWWARCRGRGHAKLIYAEAKSTVVDTAHSYSRNLGCHIVVFRSWSEWSASMTFYMKEADRRVSDMQFWFIMVWIPIGVPVSAVAHQCNRNSP